MKETTKLKRGGACKGAGAPTKAPSGVKRIAWNGKVHPATLITLQALSNKLGISQAEAVDLAIGEKWNRVFAE
jgi:hypothetical protein